MTRSVPHPFSLSFNRRWPERGTTFNASTLLGQEEWTWLFPVLHHTLADRVGPHDWPRYDANTPLQGACAYWETALYLLACLLGWQDVGLGLQRFYADDRPIVPSPHLDLLEQLWNDRGQLDLLALWAWGGGRGERQVFSDGRRHEDFRGAAWLADVLDRHPGYGVTYAHDPLHGGGNPLHLGHTSYTDPLNLGPSFRMGPAPLPPGAWFQADRSNRRAVLVLEDMADWPAFLANTGSSLPDLGVRSWHVDVVVKPVGWLGTFRRSRVTGRWFVGKHSVHMMGTGEASN